MATIFPEWVKGDVQDALRSLTDGTDYNLEANVSLTVRVTQVD